ncbi:MAG: molybdopterin-guanine dinucleotide biosynthesis protein B [Proteobacteria bacterium]|nr:molybdopterin-guanine dinucleotide biosynthesis protein B [Pseudomonadota bacterium]
MRVLAIVGHHNSGKTSLIERLIPALRARGLSVSTLKHTHHKNPSVDSIGKDSQRHALAGADEVLLASDESWTLLRHSRTPASPVQLLSELRAVDIVLIEGYKALAHWPRIEVYRGLTAEAPLAAADGGIAAVACPADLDIKLPGLRRVDLDDAAAVATLALELTNEATSRHLKTP